jgi:hypothetical protein
MQGFFSKKKVFAFLPYNTLYLVCEIDNMIMIPILPREGNYSISQSPLRQDQPEAQQTKHDWILCTDYNSKGLVLGGSHFSFKVRIDQKAKEGK